MNRSQAWLSAARPRTLPLALASIILGSFLAASQGAFDWGLFLLAVFTAACLQILSNLANDYGDSVHGADRPERIGPQRAVQSGAISKGEMKRGMAAMGVAAAIAGILLVWLAFGEHNSNLFWLFIGLGGLAIAAAIGYTAGIRPYGYAGLGDLSVLIFFGWVGVVGSYFLYVKRLDWEIMLPATSCGLLAVAVLNVNNMRDIDSDAIAGKRSIPVRIGLENARRYHIVLLGGAIATAFTYAAINFQGWGSFLFLLSLPLMVKTGHSVIRSVSADLDPYLRRTSVGALLFVLTFGLGQLL